MLSRFHGAHRERAGRMRPVSREGAPRLTHLRLPAGVVCVPDPSLWETRLDKPLL